MSIPTIEAISSPGPNTAKSKSLQPNKDIVREVLNGGKRRAQLYDLKPHPVTGRLIDSYPAHRTKPMRILCLGMSRTGTMSIFTALQQLGYTPYHMAVAMGSPKLNFNLWQEALKAKFRGEGKRWGREEFDKILGDFDAVLDVPCTCFVEELVAAYPEAKVMLSLRGVDGWLGSMAATVGRIASWNWDVVAPWDSSLAKPWWEFAKLAGQIQFRTISDFSSADTAARQAYHDQVEAVRNAVPAQRLLEYRVQEGWGPLCQLLNVAAPEGDFPQVNDRQQFVSFHSTMWWLAFAKMVGKITLLLSIPTGGAIVASWWSGGKGF